jgi:hypothetical protein
MTRRRTVPAHRTLAAAMPEDRGPDSLEAHVRKVIADLGLFGYHPRNSKGSAAGWPDWVIVGRGGILYRELKSEHGSLSPEQRHVGELITRAGGSWAVWRPRDLLDGTIARVLASLAAVQLELFGGVP